MTSGNETKKVYCRFCVAHCGLLVEVDPDTKRALGVRGDPEHPMSQGYTCAKGRSAVQAQYDQNRLDFPMMRSRDGDKLVQVGWEDCLDDIAQGISDIVQRDGPDAVGLFIGTGGSHDSAGRRLAVNFLRAINSRSQYSVASIDAPGKPLVAELVTGNAALFSPTIDFERAKLTILVGSNPLVSHGHTSGWPNPRVRLRRLMAQGEVWAVDPRRTETAMVATRHVAPRVGTDHIWLAAIARELLASADQTELASRATGINDLEVALNGYTMERAAAETGIDLDDLVELLRLIRSTKKVAIQSGTGVSMSAAAPITEWLIWVILILTNSLDTPGGVWFNPGFLRSMHERSLPPQDGSGEPGPASRPDLVSRLGEYPAVALVDEILSGNLKSLIVFGANITVAMPNTRKTYEALGQLEHLIVLDVNENTTTQLATHLLPCAAPLERADLPFITDMYLPMRATQYAPAVVPLAPERKPAWRIVAEISSRIGIDLLDGRTIESLTDEDMLRPMTKRSLLKLDQLVSEPGPHVDETAFFGWVRDSVLPDGKWRAAPQILVDRMEALTRERPQAGLALLPRRQLRQLNSQLTKSGTVDRRFAEPEILINPRDALERNVKDGESACVESAHGRVVGLVKFDDNIARGAISIPHGHETLKVNHLVSSDHDIEPLTGMMRASGLAVDISPLE